MITFSRKIRMNKLSNKLQLILILLSSLLTLSSCGDKKQNEASVVIEIPAIHKFSAPLVYAKGGSGYEALTDTTAPYAPLDVSGFDCILVNVVGPGIGDWDTNQSRVGDGSTYSYIGTYSKLIPVATGGTVEVKIKKGTKRFIQLLGIKSAGHTCPSNVTASELASTNLYPGIFLIGNVQKDVIKDEQVDIQNAYQVTTASDIRGSSSQPIPPNVDTTAPSTSTVCPPANACTVGSTSYIFKWSAASDEATLQSQLKYKIMRASSASDLSTIENALTQTLVVDWTANKTNHTINDLVANTSYHFAVLVKDSSDNVAMYPIKSITTSGSGDPSPSTYSVTYDGNGHTGGSVPTDSTAYSSGDGVALNNNTGSLVKTNNRFSGWCLTSACVPEIVYLYPASYTVLNADLTFYAYWKPTYSVTYAANGGSGSVPTDSSHYINGESVTVSDQGSLTYSGKEFSNWNTSADGLGTSYLAAATFSMASANVTLYAQWTTVTPTSFSVTYHNTNSTGGSAPSDSNAYNDGDTVTVLDNTGNLVRTSYTFAGWVDGNNSLYAAGDSITINGADIDLYPKWNSITRYHLYYETGGASGTAPSDTSTYGEGESAVVQGRGSLTLPGSSFEGWTYDGIFYRPGQSIVFYDYDMSLFPRWTTPYTVTYDTNGGSGVAPTDSTEYNGTDTVTVLGNSGPVTKSGAAFVGWNTNAEGTGKTYQKDDTFTLSNANVTLYAKWLVGTTYTVTYYGNSNTGGSVPVDSSLYVSNIGVTVLDNVNSLVRTNYRFSGWNTNSGGTGTAYSPGDTFSMGSSNVSLYAVWTSYTSGKYYVTYNSNGATSGGVPVDTTSYSKNSTVSVFENVGGLNKSGYMFVGWNTSADGSGTTYQDPSSSSPTTSFTTSNSDSTTSNRDIVLYAKWTPLTYYAITYDKNGGEGTAPVDTLSYIDGQSATLLGVGSMTPPAGKVFAGWNTKADGTGDFYSENETMLMNSSLTMYAVWSSSYSIAYDANGASSGSVPSDSSSYATGASATIASAGSLALTNKVFLGWNTSSTGAGTGYSEGQVIQVGSSNLTLYAMWSNIYYVKSTGSDSNSCTTSSSPCASIAGALSKISTSQGGEIRVAAGSYSLSSNSNTAISFKTNVSILGGYNASSWVRDYSTTTLSETSTSITIGTSSSGLSGFQKLDGFTINLNPTGTSTYSAISITNAPNTMIKNNIITTTAKQNASGTLNAVNISGRYASEISGNKIDITGGGYFGKYSYGIKFSSFSSGSSVKIHNNSIYAKLIGSSSGSTYPYAQAIEVSSGSGKSEVFIRNNTLAVAASVAGKTTATYGFGVKKGSKSSGYSKLKLYFDNNIVFGPDSQTGQYVYGIYCYSSYTCNVQSIKNNNFFKLKSIAKLNSTYSAVYNLQLAYSSASNNLSTEMVAGGYFSGAKDFHLSNSAPSSIYSGGLDGSALSWPFSTDLDRTSRTGSGATGWSIGAFEKD
jgi:uncharacterized repeat protein (TIGR02543 family)